MSVRLLFVDDDPFLLQAQRRLLWSVEDWTCTFCDSGEKALAHLAESPFDVIVSDMRMPVMTGAELCRAIRVRHPRCVRIMLSGQTESGTLCRTFGPSHQFLQKPCPPDELRQAVDRSLSLRSRLEDDGAFATIQQLELSDIVESRREVIRTSRMSSATKESVMEQLVSDPGWSASLESLVRYLLPDAQVDSFDLPGLLQPVELSQLRVHASAACVFAHLCEELDPPADVVEHTLQSAVEAAQRGADELDTPTAEWDNADWAPTRSHDEVTLSHLLHNVCNLLPFRHEAQPLVLSAALLEQLGLPHSVVAGVAARKEVGV